MRIGEKCLPIQSSSPKGPSQPKVLLVTVSRSALIFLSGKPFPGSLCNVHMSGTSQREREGRGIKKLYEITQDECYCCCCWCGKMTGSIALFIPHPKEMFSRRPDYTTSWLVVWINKFLEPFVHLPTPHFLQTLLCSIHPPKSWEISLFSLCLHLSVSPQVQDGCSSQWDPLKMSLLTDWMRHSTLCWFILPVCCSNFVNVSHQPINNSWAWPGNRCWESFTVHHLSSRSWAVGSAACLGEQRQCL